MDAEFSIWQGALLPVVRATLYGADGNPIDLTDATVTFRLIKDGVLVFEAAVTIDEEPTSGRVRFDWRDGDTDEAGLFDAQWRVLFAAPFPESEGYGDIDFGDADFGGGSDSSPVPIGGKSMMVPGNRYNRIRIMRVV